MRPARREDVFEGMSGEQIAGMGIALATVIAATCNGLAKLIRAWRGDPEYPRWWFLLGQRFSPVGHASEEPPSLPSIGA
jgi:hypothetical protein